MLILILTSFFYVSKTNLLIWVKEKTACNQRIWGYWLLLHLDFVEVVGKLHGKLFEIDGSLLVFEDLRSEVCSVVLDVFIEINRFGIFNKHFSKLTFWLHQNTIRQCVQIGRRVENTLLSFFGKQFLLKQPFKINTNRNNFNIKLQLLKIIITLQNILYHIIGHQWFLQLSVPWSIAMLETRRDLVVFNDILDKWLVYVVNMLVIIIVFSK